MAIEGRRLLPALAAGLLLAVTACAPAADGDKASPKQKQEPAAETKAAIPAGKGFDFYVLSLSWSPSYCEAEGVDANRQQCGAARPYAFVVHGLWPQFERGFPKDCATGDPRISGQMLRSLYDLMPSGGLIRHEWRTHGSCTGLDQTDYFRVLRAAREKVVIPDEFRRLDTYRTLSPQAAEAAFLKSNPGMAADSVAVTCDRRYLREIRICMTKDLGFRACSDVDRKSCRLPKVVMPPVRGG